MINNTITVVNDLGHYVVPMNLHSYCKQVGMFDEIEEIKKQIDEYLKVNQIYDVKCFQYNEHADFIREAIKYMATDEIYNLAETIKDYVQNYIDDYKSRHNDNNNDIKEDIQPVADFVIFMDKNRKIIEEIRQLQKQIL